MKLDVLSPVRSATGGAACWCLLLLGALALLSSMARAQSVSVPPLVVLAAGDLRGEIKPCGCSPQGQLGGLPRRMSYLKEAWGHAAPQPLLVDLGNNFPEPSAQGQLKVELIQSLLRQMPVQAILPGPNELALGLAALDPALPYLVSNAAPPSPLATSRLVTRTGRQVLLLGYLSPKLVYQGMHSSLALRSVDTALLREWRADLGPGQTAVLLFRGDDSELSALAQSGLFALIIAGNPSDDDLHQVLTRPVAGQSLPQVPTKGQGVLRLALGGPQPAATPPGAPPPGATQPVAPQAGTAQPAAPAVDWLSDRYPDDPAAVQALAHYDAQVKALFFQQVAEQQAHQGASPYAGAQACRGCHPGPYAVWQNSLHAQAVPTLAKVGKEYDPECLQCHVVGLHQQGFISAQATPRLANVQCENCHGPAQAHAAHPDQARPVPPVANSQGQPFEGTCRTCHRGSHSPRFAFADYWPRIQHGLDAALLPPAAAPVSPAGAPAVAPSRAGR